MAWIVRLVSLGADRAEYSTGVLQIAKPDNLADLASLGLTLAEGKRAWFETGSHAKLGWCCRDG